MTWFALVGAAVSFVLYLALRYARQIAGVADALAKVRRSHFAVFLAFALVATLCAQKSGTNSPPRGASSPRVIEPGPSVSPEDVARGYLLESVTTNAAYSYAMPANGTRYAKWWLRGAYEDVFRLDLGDFRFPLGTYMCDYLWVYTWGMAGARLRDASNRVVATGVPMSAVPGLSQFWDAPTTNGTHLLTWQDFFLGRDTNTPVSAQLELCPTGDYIARSNEVERVYRRVNPDDWDDDGDPNDTDPTPYVHDGDNFGPHQELPQGANSNAYGWVDIVVSNANALVTFTGDAPSALPDPRFIARAGETYRVIILIGKTYTMTCPMPIAVVDKSDAAIIVRQAYDRELTVCWPVEIYADEIQMRGGAAFSMSVWPDCLDGSFVWTNSCCSVSHSGDVFVYLCNDACHCTGCSAMGYYGYESYRLPAYGVWCGCSSDGEHDDRPGEEDDDGPYDAGAHASFSRSAVIFEDAYTNSPGNCVGRQSTQTSLRCVAHGGPNGGHVRFEILGEEKLERVSGHVLPVEQDVSPGKKLDFTIVYKGQLPSSAADDIIVTTTFTENVPNATQEQDEEKLTSVKVTLWSMNISLDDYPNRHIRGIGEQLSCEWMPFVPGLLFQTQNGAVCTDSYNTRRDIICPFHAVSGICSISVDDATYAPAVQVLEPTGIEARRPQRLSFPVPVNSPGGAGFQVELYIMPDTVSFQALEFWERSAYNSTIEGYFTNQAFQAVWYHDTNMCAGVWHRISNANFWFRDSAQMGDELITPVCPGRLVWHIPVDWRKLNDPALTHQDFKSVDQSFEMSDTGRLTVTKYQHWAAREMSGETLKSEGMTE